MDIIHRPAFYLKQEFSEAGGSLRFHVGPSHLGATDTATIRLGS
jgi:hypothetical protein